MTFTRILTMEAMESLKKEQLFIEHLREDCKKGIVFPAVRQDKVDFYHKGGKLFSWSRNTGFWTHHKYASVLYPQPKDYIQESVLKEGGVRLIGDFCEGYQRIKENCSLYSGEEKAGVAKLYHGFSCASLGDHDIVVLDIEVAFTEADELEKGSRIDIVTLEYATGKLRFFEAKIYSNQAAFPTSLEEQLKRYDKQLNDGNQAILNAYTAHVAVINTIFDVNIPQPQDVDTTTKAIIFGFDNEQKVYLQNKLIPKGGELQKRTYAKGDIKTADLPTIFRGGKQNWE